MDETVVEWSAYPSGMKIFTRTLDVKEARTRADIAAALYSQPVKQTVRLDGGIFRDFTFIRKLESKSVKVARRKNRTACDYMIEGYFIGLSSYKSTLSWSTGSGSALPPSQKLMLFCEIGAIIAKLPHDERVLFVERWYAWIRYQEARAKKHKDKLELRRIYRNLSRRVKYKKALKFVSDMIQAKELTKICLT